MNERLAGWMAPMAAIAMAGGAGGGSGGGGGGDRSRRPRSANRRAPQRATPTAGGILTAREVAVVRLLAAGCSYGDVATQLGISPHTVVTHIKNVYRKLDVHTAAAAVMRAVQLGVLKVPGSR